MIIQSNRTSTLEHFAFHCLLLFNDISLPTARLLAILFSTYATFVENLRDVNLEFSLLRKVLLTWELCS